MTTTHPDDQGIVAALSGGTSHNSLIVAGGYAEPLLAGARPAFLIDRADAAETAAYRELRRAVFVGEQGLFAGSDRDDVDDDPRAVVLVARAADGTVLGGVRLAPAHSPDLGWWRGSRLVVRPGARAGGLQGIGAALIRSACATVESLGVLRFDADVQARHLPLFTALGWDCLGHREVAGQPHAEVTWPVGRIAKLAAATKNPLGDLLAGMAPGGTGFVGDDGAPVPGSDLIAACDAIVPAMVERDPWWAGWCGVLVNVNDLSAMGAMPVGLLNAVAGKDTAAVAQVLAGLKAAAAAWDIPVLGGHTQLGVHAALSVTALGRTDRPVPAGGGRAGDEVRVTVDLRGGWRPGYAGRQWDSTSHAAPGELRALQRLLHDRPPAAAKDVSMAGLAGTLGMLAEASGCAAVLEVSSIPRPASATVGDWLTCFPGYAMLTADRPGTQAPASGPAETAVCGELRAGSGVSLRWPDGRETQVLDGGVTGLGCAA